MNNRYSFSHLGFTYIGEWGNESDDSDSSIIHTIVWPDNRSTPFPYSPNSFPSQLDVESFVENLIAER